MDSLKQMGAAAPVLASLSDRPKVQEMHAHLEDASKSLWDARRAIKNKDEDRPLRRFQEAFNPMHGAGKGIQQK